MSNPIPPDRRRQVTERDQRCVRCGGGGYEWHHRRSRSVPGEHQHCSCNGVLVCRSCHSWIHLNPVKALDAGLMVSRYVSEPGLIPVNYLHGRWLLGCAGEAFPT